MQEYKTLLYNLKKILHQRIRNEKDIIEKLVAITGKDYKSIWRRLNGLYKFSFDEVFNICMELGISMESLGEKDSLCVSTLKVYKFADPETFDPSSSHINKMYSILETATQSSHSSFTTICTRIPEMLSMQYDKLSKLELTKLNYFTRNNLNPDFFRMLNENWEPLIPLTQKYFDIVKKFDHITAIWEPNILRNTVKDVQFFLDLGMITPQDARDIKDELADCLATLDKMCLEPTGKFTFSISPLPMHFHSNTIKSTKINVIFYFLSHLWFAYSENEQDFISQQKIINNMMKCSIILSGNNHRERTKFIRQQYNEINIL